MIRNSSVKYEDQTIKILGNDSPQTSPQSERIIKRKSSNSYHHKENSNIKVVDATSVEEAHTSKDSDHFFKNHTVQVKNNRSASSGGVASQFGNTTGGCQLSCADKTKSQDDDCECCSSQSDTKKRLGFGEIIRNAISRIIGDLSALVNGRDKDSDGDDVEYGPVRYAPHSLSTLTQTTYFTKDELKTMYRTFKNECPTGVLYEDTFKTIYSQFFLSGDANMYAHYLFNAFDINQQGYISFEDFVKSLSGLLRGKFEEKLEWIFKIYDINHDGFITSEEMHDIVKSVFLMLGPPKNEAQPPLSPAEHASAVFDKLDDNKDGYVTYAEFVEACSRNPSIVASMKIFEEDE